MFGFAKKPDNVKFGDKDCQIAPYNSSVPPELMPNYRKLDLSQAEKAQMSELFSKFTSVRKIGAGNQPYCVATWPDGLPSILTTLTSGISLNALISGGGKASVQAPLVSLAQAGVTLLAIIMRFLLGQSNRQLTVINQKIDEILEFLYGDKKAELIAAIRFTRETYENFSSIMVNEGQRNATIHTLQTAKLTAMQDVEFYLSDLIYTSNKYNGKHHHFPDDVKEMKRIVSKVIQSSDCLDLSIQLYMITNLMEIYYAQNYTSKYLRSVKQSVENDISRCEKQMIGDYNSLKTSLNTQWRKKADWDKAKEQVHGLIKKVDQKLEPLMNNKYDDLKAQFKNAMNSLEKQTECCIGADGSVYLKIEE